MATQYSFTTQHSTGNFPKELKVANENYENCRDIALGYIASIWISLRPIGRRKDTYTYFFYTLYTLSANLVLTC